MREPSQGTLPSTPPHLEVKNHRTPPEEWDDLVHRAEGGTFCHLAGWGGVFERCFGHEAHYFAARRDGKLEGLLPFVSMPRLGLGRVWISVPYLNYGGPLGTPEAETMLQQAALDLAEGSGAQRFELRSRQASGEGMGSGLGPAREKVTVVLDLPEDPDTLFKDRFRSKLRAQIRRPMKEGMTVRFGLEEKRAFYSVFSKNMRDIGTPVLPEDFFQAIIDVFPDAVEFGVVYHQQLPVAAGCGFRFRGEFEMTWASALRKFNRSAPNMLLYWGFMERCIQEGIQRFNFGRCTPGGGTHRFKSQWGGGDEPLHWVQWPTGREGASPDSGPFRVAATLWRHLPLPVANRLGPFLARRISTF